MFEGLNTPRLVLDADRVERNAARMRVRCGELGVTLRPHVKTAKSTDVARIAADGATFSTPRQSPLRSWRVPTVSSASMAHGCCSSSTTGKPPR